MGSYISNIKISNYRSFSHERSIPIHDLTALVGYNNAGKSNILNALEWLIGNGSLREGDFYDCDKPVEVVATISRVDDAVLARLGETHRKKVAKYENDGQVVIKRVQYEPGGKASDNKFCLWDSGKGEWNYNPNGIDAAIKKLFPDTIRINAMEDAASDASKAKSTSTIGKLLKEVSGSVVDQHRQQVDATLGVVRDYLSADGQSRFGGLDAIDERINQNIGIFFPRVSVKLDIPVPDLEDLFGSGTLKIYEQGNTEGRPIQSYGHGSQRSVQMALVKLLADIKAKEQDGVATKLLLIDEPELYLHPFAIEMLAEAFDKLAKDGFQVVYSTHSAQLINKDSGGSTILVRKSLQKGSFVRKPLSIAAKEVVENPEHCQSLIYSLSNASQIFFSEKVIVAEGKTEKRILPEVYKIMNGTSLGVNNIGLVSFGGKDIYPKAHKIFEALDMPVKFVADFDFAFRSASRGDFIEKTDENYLALLDMLKDLEADNEVALDEKGHPKGKRGPCSAEDAYRKLIAREGADEHVEKIHAKFLDKNIWIWPKGSIEDHIGNESKNELGLLRYLERLEKEGVSNVCPDPEGMERFFAWVGS